MTTTELLSAADQAFSEGEYQEGLMLLRKFNVTDSANAASLNRQAVIEEQIGDWAMAGEAHYKCIELAPHAALGYLYAGSWLEQSNRIDAAAAAYSLAQEADPSSLSAPEPAATNDPTQMRAAVGNDLLRHYLSDQHRQLYSDHKEAKRIKNAVWVRTHDAPFTFNQEMYAPDLFYIPDLPKRRYFENVHFEWAERLEKNAKIIVDELKNALGKEAAEKSLRPYLPREFSTHASLQNMAGSMDWSALDLFKDGQLNGSIAELFPQTLELMQAIPAYSIDEAPYEVFFSLLKPQQQIAPHFGESNHALTVHLALDIPYNCHITVADDSRQWQEGRLLVFDDSFLHSAHNQSDKLRIVLIFSVWNPSLSKAEQEAIKLAFNTRKNWMTTRVAKLQQLLD